MAQDVAEPVVDEACRRLFRQALARMQSTVAKAACDSMKQLSSTCRMTVDLFTVVDIKEEVDKFMRYMEVTVPRPVFESFSRDSIDLAMRSMLGIVCKHTTEHFFSALDREQEHILSCVRRQGDDMIEGLMIFRSVVDQGKPPEDYN